MKLKMIVAAIAATASAPAFAVGSMNDQVQNSDNIVNVRMNSNYSQKMLNNQQVTGSVLDIFNALQSGDLAPNSIYIGGKSEIYGVYGNQIRNSNRKYVPGALIGGMQENGKVTDNSNTNIKMPYTDLAFTSTIGDWVTGFANLQVTNVGSSNVNLPNAYFVLGNLSKSPFYFAGGKKVVEFGKFDSVTNFMPTLTSAYFMAYGVQVVAGYSQNGVNATASLMNGLGGAMLNSQASSANQVNNFALNTSYNGKAGNLGYYAGLGYINSTGFVNKDNRMVGALDLNAGVNVQGISVNGELLLTTSGAHGMSTSSTAANAKNSSSKLNDKAGYTAFGFNALPALILFGNNGVNGNSNSVVKAWGLDSSYTMPVAGKDMIPYVSYSQVAQNYDNNLYQFEVGTRYNVVDSVWIGGSYNYMSGKANAEKVGRFNTVMFDATVYF